jgi:hypothetical protein
MKHFFTFIFLILLNLPIYAQQSDQFEKLFPILTAEPEGKEISPKTTAELEKLFDTPKEVITTPVSSQTTSALYPVRNVVSVKVVGA